MITMPAATTKINHYLVNHTKLAVAAITLIALIAALFISFGQPTSAVSRSLTATQKQSCTDLGYSYAHGQAVDEFATVNIYQNGNNLCADTIHTAAYWGVKMPTVVCVSQGLKGACDQGQYKDFAGPLEWQIKSNSDCREILGQVSYQGTTYEASFAWPLGCTES